MPFIRVLLPMKDRIKQIMESQHMTQQAFSQFTGISSSVLSGIFTGRTKPTLKQVEAIIKKIPVSLDWLILGKGDMYVKEAEQQHNQPLAAQKPAPQPAADLFKDERQLTPTPSPAKEIKGVAFVPKPI